MDTKQLLIKTQKNVLKWALVISILYFAVALLGIYGNPSSKASWFSGVIHGVIFGLFIRVRLKQEPRMALFAIGAFAILLIDYLVVFFINLSATIQKIKLVQAQSQVGIFTLLFGAIFGYGLFFLTGFLYYKAYKSTLLISQLNQETVEVESIEIKPPH
jgi:hypothetical protein